MLFGGEAAVGLLMIFIELLWGLACEKFKLNLAWLRDPDVFFSDLRGARRICLRA